MILPTLRKLFRGDFKPEFQDLIDTMTPTVNNGLEVIYNAFNRNISFRDNILCTIKDITLEVDTSGIPKAQTSFTLNTTTNRIDGCTVLKAINLTNTTTYPTGAPFISFSQSGSQIIINNITGLQANNSYRITVRADGA